MVEIWKGFINGITDRGEEDLGIYVLQLSVCSVHKHLP
jgi:hypothetical protein